MRLSAKVPVVPAEFEGASRAVLLPWPNNSDNDELDSDRDERDVCENDDVVGSTVVDSCVVSGVVTLGVELVVFVKIARLICLGK